MISAGHPGTSWFMLVAGVFFLLAYALPLLFAPLAWARLFRWRLPAERDLAVYLGRCVGALAVALIGAGFVAARDPHRHAVVLLHFTLAASILCGVHLWGALRREQPWTETAEIVLYGAVAAVSLWLYLGVR